MNRRNFFSMLTGLFTMAWLPWKKAAPIDEELEQFERLLRPCNEWVETVWEKIKPCDIIRRVSEPEKCWQVNSVSKDFLMVEPFVLTRIDHQGLHWKLSQQLHESLAARRKWRQIQGFDT